MIAKDGERLLMSRLLWACLAIGALYGAVAGGECLRWGGQSGIHLWADGGWTLAGILAVAACIWRAQSGQGHERTIWRLFALGCGSWLVGQLGWDVYDLTGSFPPFPSVADLGYLGFAPLFLIGFLTMSRGNRLTRWLLGLDIAVLACALSVLILTVTWASVQDSPLPVSGQVGTLLYPIFYLSLACSVLLVSVRQTWRNLSLLLLFLGLLGQVLPFTLWTTLLLDGRFTEGTILDGIWMVGMLLIAASAVAFRSFPTVTSEGQVHGVLAFLPLALSAAAAVTRLWDAGRTDIPQGTQEVLTALLALVVVFTGIRLSLTLRRSRQLFTRARAAHSAAEVAAQALRDKADRLQTLTEISRVVSGTLDPQTLYDTIYEQIGRVMDTSQFFIALYHPDLDIISVPYLREEGVLFTDEQFPFGDNTTSVVIDTGRPLLYLDEDEYGEFARDNGLTSSLVGNKDSASGIFVPLHIGHRTIGALSVQSGSRRAYTHDDVQILSIIASQAAVAIENARLFTEQAAQLEEVRCLGETLEERDEELRAIFEGSGIGISLTDKDGKFLDVNPALAEMLGFEGEELRQLSFADVTNERDLDAEGPSFQELQDGRRDRYQIEKRYVRKDGTDVWVRLTVSAVREADGGMRYSVGMVEDIADRKELEDELAHRAFHDDLTGLPNRALFLEHLNRAIEDGIANETSFALLLMDLDGFKEVNDVFGHHHGDYLLESIGPRVQPSLREADTLARLGGDEFAMLLPGAQEEGATIVARALMEAIDEPFTLGDHTVRIGTSVGIAVFPQHGADASALLRHADVSMYVAKRTRAGVVVYEPRMDEEMAERLLRVSDLHRAIQGNEFVLHYQPKVDPRTGRIDGVEGLIRWQHPRRGLIGPNQFVPSMEETGMVRFLTSYVLDSALCQCREWRERGHDLRVAVNLAPSDLHAPLFADLVLEKLHEWGLPASCLQLEITERAIMTDAEQARRTLAQLHDAGVGTCMDDFGVGASSLMQLKQLPIDEIKIDKSFVARAAHDSRDARIVRSIIDLSHGLGIKAVSEGVEDDRTYTMLRHMGCDLVQGDYVGTPMPGADLEAWMYGRSYGGAPLEFPA